VLGPRMTPLAPNDTGHRGEPDLPYAKLRYPI
jgi:hypothetical protein